MADHLIKQYPPQFKIHRTFKNRALFPASPPFTGGFPRKNTSFEEMLPK
jgi:hypothetical protein